MAYEYITSYNSPAKTEANRTPADVDYIVIHHWDDPARNPTFQGTVNWQARAGADAAAHYTAEAGRIACLVDPSDIAWHAGNWDANQRSVGIECNPRASAEDYATVAELVRELRAAGYGPELRPHKSFKSTSCPGRWNLDRINELAGTPAPAAPAKPATKPAPAKPPAAKSIAQLAAEVIAGKHGSGEARQRSLGTRYAAVQAEVNRQLAPKAKTIKQLAAEVLAGKHGSGQARINSLGARYAAVQAEVNRQLA